MGSLKYRIYRLIHPIRSEDNNDENNNNNNNYNNNNNNNYNNNHVINVFPNQPRDDSKLARFSRICYGLILALFFYIVVLIQPMLIGLKLDGVIASNWGLVFFPLFITFPYMICLYLLLFIFRRYKPIFYHSLGGTLKQVKTCYPFSLQFFQNS